MYIYMYIYIYLYIYIYTYMNDKVSYCDVMFPFGGDMMVLTSTSFRVRPRRSVLLAGVVPPLSSRRQWVASAWVSVRLQLLMAMEPT